MQKYAYWNIVQYQYCLWFINNGNQKEVLAVQYGYFFVPCSFITNNI